jgi:hypothetical protein
MDARLKSRLLSWPITCVLVAVWFGASLATGIAEEPISYNRDIRPILSDKCFQCHGPDEESRQAELRLDMRQSAIEDRGDGAAIAPNDPTTSHLLERITSDDESVRMPPPETNKTVTSAEAAKIRDWIEQGAKYEGHWSFSPISRPSLPVVTNGDWAKNEIDHFISAGLASKGLTPSPLATPATQVRRVYLDLLGILPPPDVVQRFAADPTDKAYVALVDKLLANPQYGERWGRYWLDQARYADSHGYTIDGDRTMWPYRDWVIHALNRDMPFDQFTIEQLAGDLLDSPTRSQLVATGFHRNTLINQEGGTDNEQFRNEEVVDRVNTTSAVWLGLTVGCAQCHTHKFDPITQKEFYQLFAFFNDNEDVNNTGPTVEVHENELFLGEIPPSLQEKLQLAQQQVAELRKTRGARQEKWVTELLASLRNEGNLVEWQSLRPTETKSRSAKLTVLDDGSVLAAKGEEKELYTVTFAVEPGTKIGAVRLRVIPHHSLPNKGPGLAGNGNFVLTDVHVAADEQELSIIRAQASHHQPKFPIENSLDGKPTTGWAINVAKGSKKKMNAPHEAHFILENMVTVEGKITLTLDHQANGSFYNVGRFAVDISESAPTVIVEAQLLAALGTVAAERTDAMKKILTDEFTKQDAEVRVAERAVQAVKNEIGYGAVVRSMVMRDRAEPRETFVQIRGDFLRPDKDLGPVTAGVPAVFPALPPQPQPPQPQPPQPQPPQNGPPQKKRTRLDLARWLVAPQHPLTSRVTVNRIWLRYFGDGLVTTDNDFGTQGTYPTHPALLDWLAAELMESAWSLKAIHRKIVTSATYRQSSHVRDDLVDTDPLNRWLGRQNRLRFDAEIIRDAALSASDLLEKRIGGPSVRPPQPEGVYAFTQTKKNWSNDAGANRYRRALYTRFYRSAPYPLFTTFDSPDFQAVCTSRVRSNTPLQSLMMANDAAQFELSQGLAARVLAEVPGSESERISRIYRICMSRAPSANERSAVSGFLERQTKYFESAPEDARRIAPSAIAEPTRIAKAASWTTLARALMNTDEFITRE